MVLESHWRPYILDSLMQKETEEKKSLKGQKGHRWTSEEAKEIHRRRKERREARIKQLSEKMVQEATKPVTNEALIEFMLGKNKE